MRFDDLMARDKPDVTGGGGGGGVVGVGVGVDAGVFTGQVCAFEYLAFEVFDLPLPFKAT
jgi:hypothetical protein